MKTKKKQMDFPTNNNNRGLDASNSNANKVCLPNRPKVLENDNQKLVLVQDTKLAWCMSILFPLFLPCIFCMPTTKWTFDKNYDSIVREEKQCYQCNFNKINEYKLSNYHSAINEKIERRETQMNNANSPNHGVEQLKISYIVRIIGKDATTSPINMTPECGGSPMEYEDCSCMCHPSDEEQLVLIMNGFFAPAESLEPIER